VKQNIVTVKDGATGGTVKSTYLIGGSVGTNIAMKGNAIATDNQVQILGGAVTSRYIFGGSAFIEGIASALNNTVTVSGGALTPPSGGGNMEGGYAYSTGYVDATASNNKVVLTGGTLSNMSIYGGSAYTTGSTARANDNTVDVGADVILTGTDQFWGGSASGPNPGSQSQGNILNLRQSGLKVQDMRYFQILNFYLPPEFKSGDAMLIATSIAYLDGVTKDTVNIHVGSAKLQVGDTVVLVDGSSGAMRNGPVIGDKITTGDYTFTVTKDAAHNKQLEVTLEEIVLPPPPPPPPPPPIPPSSLSAIPAMSGISLALLGLLLAAGAARRLRRGQIALQ